MVSSIRLSWGMTPVESYINKKLQVPPLQAINCCSYKWSYNPYNSRVSSPQLPIYRAIYRGCSPIHNWYNGPHFWYICNISRHLQVGYDPPRWSETHGHRHLCVGRCMWWVHHGRCWWISMFMESIRCDVGWTAVTWMSRKRIAMVKFTRIMCFLCVFVCVVVPIVKVMILVFFGVCVCVCVCSKWWKKLLMKEILQQIFRMR